MELTYLPTGQRIVFHGTDDPLKLKGVKFTRGYAAVIWFEELGQFDGIDAMRSILNLLRRGGDDFVFENGQWRPAPPFVPGR